MLTDDLIADVDYFLKENIPMMESEVEQVKVDLIIGYFKGNNLLFKKFLFILLYHRFCKAIGGFHSIDSHIDKVLPIKNRRSTVLFIKDQYGIDMPKMEISSISLKFQFGLLILGVLIFLIIVFKKFSLFMIPYDLSGLVMPVIIIFAPIILVHLFFPTFFENSTFNQVRNLKEFVDSLVNYNWSFYYQSDYNETRRFLFFFLEQKNLAL